MEVRMSKEGLLSIGQLAQRLNISRARVYQMAQDGEIPGIKVGSLWRFREQDIDDYLDRNVNTRHSNEVVRA